MPEKPTNRIRGVKRRARIDLTPRGAAVVLKLIDGRMNGTTPALTLEEVQDLKRARGEIEKVLDYIERTTPNRKPE